jgi:hypothetical protein
LLIERHVFGSYKGYATLAQSGGVSSDDAQALEGSAYGFGQSQDRKFLKSLRSQPAYFTRNLRGGRRALTRVLEGNLDDNGRPTLCMITAVISQRDWDTELAGDVSLLLSDPSIWQWDSGGEIEAIEKTFAVPDTALSRRGAGRVVELISQLERSMAAGLPMVVSCQDYSEDEMRAVEMLVPPGVRGQFRSARRSLSSQLGVTLNCIATEAPEQKLTFRPGGDGTPTPFGEFIWQNGLAEGRIPVAEVITYHAFGRGIRAAAAPVAAISAPPPASSDVEEHRGNSMRIALILLAMAIMFLSGLITGIFVWQSKHPAVVVTATSSEAPVASATASPSTTGTIAMAAKSTPVDQNSAATASASSSAAIATAEKPAPSSTAAASSPPVQVASTASAPATAVPTTDPSVATSAPDKSAEAIARELAQQRKQQGRQHVQMVLDEFDAIKFHSDFERDRVRARFLADFSLPASATDPSDDEKRAEKAAAAGNQLLVMFSDYDDLERGVSGLKGRTLTKDDVDRLKSLVQALTDSSNAVAKALQMKRREYGEIAIIKDDAMDLMGKYKPTTQK